LTCFIAIYLEKTEMIGKFRTLCQNSRGGIAPLTLIFRTPMTIVTSIIFFITIIIYTVIIIPTTKLTTIIIVITINKNIITVIIIIIIMQLLLLLLLSIYFTVTFYWAAFFSLTKRFMTYQVHRSFDAKCSSHKHRQRQTGREINRHAEG